MDILLLWFALLLFALRVASEFSLVILAIAAVRAVNHFVPRKPGRLSSALKVALSELFKKR